MAAAGLSIVDFVNVGIECTLRQLLDHGYFHADPHPGVNITGSGGELYGGCFPAPGSRSQSAALNHRILFPLPAGNLLATTSGDLVYLDFGMMSEAPQYARCGTWACGWYDA